MRFGIIIAMTTMDRRFDRLDRKKADRTEVRRLGQRLDALDGKIARSAEETRRHMDVVIESLRDDLRIFADAIAGQSERLDRREARIIRLERRPS